MDALSVVGAPIADQAVRNSEARSGSATVVAAKMVAEEQQQVVSTTVKQDPQSFTYNSSGDMEMPPQASPSGQYINAKA